ncbi:MAG TPA: HIT family protein [Actinomycetes bacterium]|nr:HIT family protein [Actinomycetes bacterium]
MEPFATVSVAADYKSDWETWGPDWEGQKKGDGCPLCGLVGVQENDWGVRILNGSFIDGYLWKRGILPGYCVAIWKLGHTVEPTELTEDQAVGYWSEILKLGRAIETAYQPTKMNYQTLGNGVPHLHTHVIPRHAHDPAPHGPLPWSFLDDGRQDLTLLSKGTDALRSALDHH